MNLNNLNDDVKKFMLFPYLDYTDLIMYQTTTKRNNRELKQIVHYRILEEYLKTLEPAKRLEILKTSDPADRSEILKILKRI